jgi:hypothetical protein
MSSMAVAIPLGCVAQLAAKANVRAAHVKAAPAAGRSHKPRNLAKSVTVE